MADRGRPSLYPFARESEFDSAWTTGMHQGEKYKNRHERRWFVPIVDAAGTHGFRRHDPGLGVLHFDSRKRDSLDYDLMEPVRPQVDAYVLEWISRRPLRREWFFERRDGTCRLMGSFAVGLSETAPTWARAIAPLAERVSRTLWSTIRKPAR